MSPAAIPDVPTDVATPEGGREAEALVAGLDSCLLTGFGRLGPEQTGALGSLSRAVAGSPIGAAVERAIAAISVNVFRPGHCAALAAARSAILGACHDALIGRSRGVLGRAVVEAPAAVAAGGEPNVLCD